MSLKAVEEKCENDEKKSGSYKKVSIFRGKNCTTNTKK